MALINTDNVVFIEALESELSSIPVSNGQIIFVKDHKSILWDVDSLRIELTQAIILNKETDRTLIEVEATMSWCENNGYEIKQ